MTAGARLESLETRDLSTLSAAEATAALHDVSVIRGTTDRLEAALVRRLGELHEAGQSAPPSDVLARTGTTSRHTVEKTERRADALGETPRLNETLGPGTVGVEHADAVAAAASRLDDDQRVALFVHDDDSPSWRRRCRPRHSGGN